MISFPEVYHKREVEKAKQTSDSLQFQSSVCFHMFLLSFCSFILCNKGILFCRTVAELCFCNNFHLNIYAMMNLAYTIYCTGGGVISKEFAIHPVDFFPKLISLR